MPGQKEEKETTPSYIMVTDVDENPLNTSRAKESLRRSDSRSPNDDGTRKALGFQTK